MRTNQILLLQTFFWNHIYNTSSAFSTVKNKSNSKTMLVISQDTVTPETDWYLRPTNLQDDKGFTRFTLLHHYKAHHKITSVTLVTFAVLLFYGTRSIFSFPHTITTPSLLQPTLAFPLSPHEYK